MWQSSETHRAGFACADVDRANSTRKFFRGSFPVGRKAVLPRDYLLTSKKLTPAGGDRATGTAIPQPPRLRAAESWLRGPGGDVVAAARKGSWYI